MSEVFDPEQAITEARREFGEHGGVAPSIERSSTFTVLEPGAMPEIFEGKRGPDRGGCYLYSRHFNPTVSVLDRYLAAMEGTEFAVSTASGMSAIACTLMQLCRTGDHIVASRMVYGGTHALLDKLLPQHGVSTSFVDPQDVAGFEKAMRPETKVIYVETVGNPTLSIPDLEGLGKLARANGAKLVVDNTFTPMVVSPARLGADVVVYSMTKYINGASDILAGCICCSQEFGHSLYDLFEGRVMLLGPTIDPRSAFDLIQRLPHLGLRMREHSRRAMAIAELLEKIGVPVIYPGLASHPQHERFRQMANPGYGFGGMVAVDCGTVERANELLAVLQNEEEFGLIAVSLGYFDTLMSCSGSSTSSEIDVEEQQEMGLSPGLLRLSIGYTGSLDSRLAQIERGVRKALGIPGATSL
ncbi:MAG: aminotransferase class V-fold PLP-dependent enzyme [Verrucomicrobiota bacterium]